MPSRSAAVATASSSDAWSAFKRKLAEDTDWIKYFLTPIEERVADLITAATPSTIVYEPLLVEQWFSDLKSLLERCLAYRKEARELEIKAIKAAVDYQQFVRLSRDNEQLEISALAASVFIAQKSASTSAATAFSTSSNDLSKGFAASMTALASQGAAALANAQERQALISDKWSAMRDSEEAYRSRHISPGNAHNYQEQYARVLTLYSQDLAEAIAKANALSGGLLAIYQRTSVPPAMKAPFAGYLDSLVYWVRAEATQLDGAQQGEVEYTLVVPMVQPWISKNEDGFVAYRDLKDATVEGGGPIRLKLEGAFKHQARVRIRGIGMCFGTQPGAVTENWHDRVSSVRIRATIHPPEQKAIPGHAAARRRSPTVIGNVRFISDDTQTQLVGGRCCANVDPTGEWTIFIEPLAVDADKDERTLDWNWLQSRVVTDLKLILKIVALPDSGLISVFR